MPQRLIGEYLDRGVALLQGYGLTEAAPLVLLLDPLSSLTKIGSAGRPPLLVDILIVGPDGIAVSVGETGELLVRGPNVMAGYWNQPEATAQVMTSDGWLRTGDAARADDEGYVWIVDRMADQFISDGRPVYPADVERALIGHPSIDDVGVVPIPADDGQQLVVAVAVTAPGSTVTEEELVAYGNEHLAHHEAPSSVTFVDRLPRTSVGKLARAVIRAHAMAEPPGGRPT